MISTVNGTAIFGPDCNIGWMPFFQMTVMTVIAQLGVVGPVSSYRTGRFDVLGKLKEQFPYLFRELAFLLPCLSGKGDCPCHGEIIYLFWGYFKADLMSIIFRQISLL